MTRIVPQTSGRRQFLRIVGGLACGALGAIARGDDLPPNTNPRTIYGDSVEPD